MSSEASPSSHPSFLALDRHALGVGAPDVGAHVAGCETCRARLALPEPAADLPAWARQLEPRPRAWFPWPALARPRAFRFAVAALASVLLVWTAGSRLITREAGRHAAGGYLGTKGDPVLWLYVKRGERVELWDGSHPIAPGDLLRLKVHPDRFSHISVFGASRAPGGYDRLYDDAIAPGQPATLPFSWKVDAQPADEVLLIVLGSEAIAPDQVSNVLARDREGRHWARRLVLSKTTPQRGATGGGSSP